MVIAWLLTHWFLTQARNLGHYGINHVDVMSEVRDNGKVAIEMDQYSRAQQTELLEEVDVILDKLKSSNDEMIIAKYEHRLRFISGKLTTSPTDEVFSIDAMIESASEARSKNQRMQQRQMRATASGPGPFQNRNSPYHSYNQSRRF